MKINLTFLDSPAGDVECTGEAQPVADPEFPTGGAPTPGGVDQILAENCMKMKEIGPRGGARP